VPKFISASRNGPNVEFIYWKNAWGGNQKFIFKIDTFTESKLNHALECRDKQDELEEKRAQRFNEIMAVNRNARH